MRGPFREPQRSEALVRHRVARRRDVERRRRAVRGRNSLDQLRIEPGLEVQDLQAYRVGALAGPDRSSLVAMFVDFLDTLRTGNDPYFTLTMAQRDLRLLEQAERCMADEGEPAATAW